MTTKVVVKANHGWPVSVTRINTMPAVGSVAEEVATVEPDEERTFYVWDNSDIRIHEVQPRELVEQTRQKERPSPSVPKFVEKPLVGQRSDPITVVRMVASESDDRTANNAVRHQYRVLTEAEKARMVAIKDKGAEFLALIASTGSSRELSLATTKVEESVMWAVKHVTK